MVNGILIVDKPQDWTSHDVVAKVRGLFREKRVGHGGTLDPLATGVLPLFLGRATRVVEFAAEGDKHYVATLRLGVTTTTQDITGDVTATAPVTATAADVAAVLPQFTGPIFQIPPMYSALKQDGKKLYELARKGVTVERAPRPITIHALTLTQAPAPGDFTLEIHCSKGTYIRTLCHDIGNALGCGGVMATLRRTKAAGFTLAQSVTLDDLMATTDPASLLLPVETYFATYPAVTLQGDPLFRAKNGRDFPCPQPDGRYRVYDDSGVFVLVGDCLGGTMTTLKSFFEV